MEKKPVSQLSIILGIVVIYLLLRSRKALAAEVPVTPVFKPPLPGVPISAQIAEALKKGLEKIPRMPIIRTF